MLYSISVEFRILSVTRSLILGTECYNISKKISFLSKSMFQPSNARKRSLVHNPFFQISTPKAVSSTSHLTEIESSADSSHRKVREEPCSYRPSLESQRLTGSERDVANRISKIMFQRGFQLAGNAPSEEFILSREEALIRSEGPTLGGFAQSLDSAGVFNEQLSTDGRACLIQLRNDNNANIRMFYYSLLCVCFEKDCHSSGSDYSSRILGNLKKQIYSDNLQLDQFNMGEIEQRYRPIYKDAYMKKILVEFLHLMNYSEYGVTEMIRRYPVIDTILVIVFRSILCSTTIKYTKVLTSALAEYLRQVIGLKIEKRATNEYSIEATRMTITEHQNFTFVLKEEPYLKRNRRSSLANNLSSSDCKTSDLWEDPFELPITKSTSRYEKPSRLTGLQYHQQINTRKIINSSHRGKQQSLDPVSLDFDSLLVIPKHPSISIGTDDTDVLVIPKRDDNDSPIKNQPLNQTQYNPKVPRPYPQAARMTQDPRLYISNSPLVNGRFKTEMEACSHTSLQPDPLFSKTQQHKLHSLPFSSPPLNTGKSQKSLQPEISLVKSKIFIQNPLAHGIGSPSPKPLPLHILKSNIQNPLGLSKIKSSISQNHH